MVKQWADARLVDRSGRLVVRPGLTSRSLEIFLAVAEHGSMSAAAERLGLTQPTVSQAIGALEAALEVQLFDRSVRPPALTLQATGLVEHAQAIVRSVEKFEGALRLGSMARLSRLRIGMQNSFAVSMGSFVIDRLRGIATELNVSSGFEASRIRAVADRDVDFAITTEDAPLPPEVRALPVFSEPLLIIAPKSYAGDPGVLKHLSADLDLIRFGRDQNLLGRVDRALEAQGVSPQRRYHLDTGDAVLQMVAAGAGWTILSPLAVYRSFGRGEGLKAAHFPEPGLRRTLFLVFRKDDGHQIASQIHSAAISALRENFLPNLGVITPDVTDQIVLH